MEYEKETCINDGKCWFQNKQTSGEWDIPEVELKYYDLVQGKGPTAEKGSTVQVKLVTSAHLQTHASFLTETNGYRLNCEGSFRLHIPWDHRSFKPLVEPKYRARDAANCS